MQYYQWSSSQEEEEVCYLNNFLRIPVCETSVVCPCDCSSSRLSSGLLSSSSWVVQFRTVHFQLVPVFYIPVLSVPARCSTQRPFVPVCSTPQLRFPFPVCSTPKLHCSRVGVPRTMDDGRFLAERTTTTTTENAGRTRLLDRPKINTNHNVWGFQNKEIYCTWFFLKLISCIWSWDPGKPLICKSLVTVLLLSIYPSFCPLLFTHRSILKWNNFHCSVNYCGC